MSQNILQIENELYSPIRPKQPTRSMEKPTDALVRRGVDYIEVRALDINPFSPTGIEATQMDFLDVYLLTCLMMPSEELNPDSIAEARDNMDAVVLEGRNPELDLHIDGQPLKMQQWAEDLFKKFDAVAAVLDTANNSTQFSQAVADQREKLTDSDKTPSGRILNILLEDNADNSALGLLLAKEYADAYDRHEYTHYSEQDFIAQAQASLKAQQDIENADEKDFETFIRDYYNEPRA